MLVAELIVIPTGILTVALLTRTLGPAKYGLLGLAETFVGWAEWAVIASFTRATVKFVSEASDWQPIASRAVQLQFASGIAAGLALAALSEPIAALMHEPALAALLRLYAIDVPIYALSQAHRDVLIGRGLFKERALAGGWRLIARFILIATLLRSGFSIEGSILGGIGSSIVELAICRWYVRPRIFVPSGFPARAYLGYVAPLSLYALSVKLFDKMDLVSFKAFGGSAAAAGFYSSAENLTALPSLLAASFTPLLLSALGDSLRTGDLAAAKTNARRALGAMFILLPLAGILPGMSAELCVALYGQAFAAAAPLFSVMNFGAMALFFVSVIASVLVAGGRPGATTWIMAPLLCAQVAGNMLVVPRFGAIGAAWVTTICSIAGFVAAIATAYRVWGILPPLGLFLRSITIALAAYAAAISFPLSGPIVFVKFALLSLAVVAVFWLFGDLPGLSKPRLPGAPAMAPAPPVDEAG